MFVDRTSGREDFLRTSHVILLRNYIIHRSWAEGGINYNNNNNYNLLTPTRFADNGPGPARAKIKNDLIGTRKKKKKQLPAHA